MKNSFTDVIEVVGNAHAIYVCSFFFFRINSNRKKKHIHLIGWEFPNFSTLFPFLDSIGLQEFPRLLSTSHGTSLPVLYQRCVST